MSSKSDKNNPPLKDDITPAQREIGHQIRRLHQKATAHFLKLSESADITPVQYACLNAVALMPDEDQRTIAKYVAIDRSTINTLTTRLEARGLLNRIKINGKRIGLSLTPEGRECVDRVQHLVENHSNDMLAPLNQEQQIQFKQLLDLLLKNNKVSGRV